MQIRLAEEKDIVDINRIYNQAIRQGFCTAHLEPLDIEYTRHWFSDHVTGSYPVFVSYENEKVTGWISLGPYRSDRQALTHVGEVSYYVDRNHQGRGVGSRLLAHAIDVSPSCGITVLIAILLDKNPASIGILEKFGFSMWGCMPGIAKIGLETADHLYFGLKL